MSTKRLKRPVEEVRAELLKDESTRQIAEKLGMELEAYVEKVLEYAQNPDKQPEFNLISEAEAQAKGVATVREVKQWFEDVADGKVDLREPHERDSFDHSTLSGNRKKAPVELGGKPAETEPEKKN
jgi:DNA-directed RNA polymerase specialized sigma subunit